MNKLREPIKNNGLKEGRNFKNLSDFVKFAVQENYGDYNNIYQQMTTLNRFSGSEKNLAQIKEIYQRLFTADDKKIDNLKLATNEFTIKCEDRKDVCKVAIEVAVNHEYEVGVHKDKEPNIMLNMKKKITSLDGYQQDDVTTLCFSDQHITYKNSSLFISPYVNSQSMCCRNNSLDNYICYDFDFDKDNLIEKVSYESQSSQRGYCCRTKSIKIDLSDSKNDETGMTK